MAVESDRAEIEAVIASQAPVEMAIAGRIVRRVVWVGPLLILAFGALRGFDGAVAAAVGVAIVVGYYLLTGLVMSRSVRLSLNAYYIGALFGFVARLGLMALTMWFIARTFDVDRLALGVSVVVAYLSLLVWEAAAMTADRKGATR